MKLHVSAFIGHLQVSTIIEDESIYAVKLCEVVDLEISISTTPHSFYSVYRLIFSNCRNLKMANKG